MATSSNINLKFATPNSDYGGSDTKTDADTKAVFEEFTLPGFSPPVKVTLARDLDERFDKEVLQRYEPFIEWINRLKTSLDLQLVENEDSDESHPFHDDPYELQSIHIQAVDFFGQRIGFLKYQAIIRNVTGNKAKPMYLPGSIFMRGGSVGMLMILRPKDAIDEKWVILTEQPRIPVGSLTFLEIPAGMIDEETKDFRGTAAKEIEEETGLKINADHLVDMTELALRGSSNPEDLKLAMYPSPGGCDEFIALFLWEQEMERLEIESLREKLTGDKRQGEMITLKLVPYGELWRIATRDAKAMVAWALYENLKRAGILDDYGNVINNGDADTAPYSLRNA